MQELRFDDDIRFTATVSSDQAWLKRALGAHELSVQLAVGVSPFIEAGKILALETDLFGSTRQGSATGSPGPQRTWRTPRRSLFTV
ncbi:hypothetical protein AB0M11_27750 [Streptomyces sp. NPDC051987]|uniref:hypothetical protein n=1 Tax=Streptomyces sp. NPDC051987 TaxID=3155808 RepID=UPI003430A0E4